MTGGVRLRAENEKAIRMKKNAIGKLANAKRTRICVCVQSGKPVRKASDEKIETP